MGKLEGKIALVTGSGRNIGRATVLSINAGSLYGDNGACIGLGFSFLIFAGLSSAFARAFADLAVILVFVCRAAIERSE